VNASEEGERGGAGPKHAATNGQVGQSAVFDVGGIIKICDLALIVVVAAVVERNNLRQVPA
jgi:hypothetical protein